MKKTRTLVAAATDRTATLAARHEAFGELVRLYQDMAYACACAALCDPHLAEDAAQEAFVTAWARLSQLREPAAFPGWLKRILRTECCRVARGRGAQLVPLGETNEPAASGAGPQGELEEAELRASVLDALSRLPRGERTVVALFHLGGHTHAEIAEFLSLTETTVAKRLRAGRARLRGLAMSEFKDRLGARLPSRDATFAARVRRGVFDDYLGRYRYVGRPRLEVVITREGERLFGAVGGQRNELFARRDDSQAELRTREFDGRGEFVRNRAGRVTHFVYYEFGREMGRAKKIARRAARS